MPTLNISYSYFLFLSIFIINKINEVNEKKNFFFHFIFFLPYRLSLSHTHKNVCGQYKICFNIIYVYAQYFFSYSFSISMMNSTRRRQNKDSIFNLFHKYIYRENVCNRLGDLNDQ